MKESVGVTKKKVLNTRACFKTSYKIALKIKMFKQQQEKIKPEVCLQWCNLGKPF